MCVCLSCLPVASLKRHSHCNTLQHNKTWSTSLSTSSFQDAVTPYDSASVTLDGNSVSFKQKRPVIWILVPPRLTHAASAHSSLHIATCLLIYMYIYIYVYYMHTRACTPAHVLRFCEKIDTYTSMCMYRLATVGRIDKITGLFCKSALQKRRYSMSCDVARKHLCGWVVSEITNHITYLCTGLPFAVWQLWGGCD